MQGNELKIERHPLMPQEMVLRASVYADTGDLVQLALETKDGTWTVFGSGKTLSAAAVDLFRLVDHAGGVPSLMQRTIARSRAMGFKPVTSDQSQSAGMSE